jgi:DNA-binding LytR/AlgR family response regulator
MNVLIIEDELLATKNLLSVLEEIGGISVIGCLESIKESVEWFRSNPLPEMVFMDIHLADGLAFEIFDAVAITCPVIFTTAYDEYALKAFKVNSIDYILKPIESTEVKKALSKYKALQPKTGHTEDLQQLIAALKLGQNYQSVFLVPSKGDKLIPLSTEDIALVYIENSITKAVTFQEKILILEHTMDEISHRLNPSAFFRANRQFIIGRSAIRDVDLWFGGRLSINMVVKTPEKIILSKARIADFRKWYTGV